jgi:hypothetical protein
VIRVFRTARVPRAYAHSHARLIMSARDARGPEEHDYLQLSVSLAGLLPRSMS